MSDISKLLQASSFASRAHRHQIRKDGQTPYISHPFRVTLIISQVFQIHDHKILMAALLHDTIEDTTTDFDDVVKLFGSDVANWVALLTKDKRLPDDKRESNYMNQLKNGPWQVHICKLADIYDNICDCTHLSPEAAQRTRARSQSYLDALRPNITEQTRKAFELVEQKIREFKP